jgi:acyl-coenzyme A synthetase/AMP-(fatty) acid ligase
VPEAESVPTPRRSYADAYARFSWQDSLDALGWSAGVDVNLADTIVERHAGAGRCALRWFGKEGTERAYGFDELARLANRVAGFLATAGVGKGDRVAGYLLWPRVLHGCARHGRRGRLPRGGAHACVGTPPYRRARHHQSRDDTDFWFEGRADDVIKSAGYRIGPFEIESVILEHPAVAEAAVVGKPDALRGQIVKAFVVLRPGAPASSSLADEIVDLVKSRVGRHQYPREVEVVRELPKTETGKIQRFLLRQR